MAISTYDDLRTAIISWSHRSGDSEFEALVPDFIRLAEARFNRVLRVSDMEEDFPSTTLTDGAASLPAGFLSFKELRFDAATRYTLEPKSLEWIRSQDNTSSADPRAFAVTKDQVLVWPPTGPIIGTYYTEIPALADSSTNWLLDSSPELYLFAALTESALWLQDDSRIPLWADKASTLLDMVQRTDDRNLFDGGILTVVAR